MATQMVQEQAEHISALLRDKLGMRGKDLEARLRKAGRLVPRRVRSDALFLAQASKLAANPKLVKMIDPARANAAYDACVRHFEAIDVAARRRNQFLNWLGGIAFMVLVLFAAIITVLVWRGFL
ncbi:hypothetical protein [Pseudogemmobacter sp. W21_MBD1_M6]|jgi:hypothetical protein|uniref:hypothetical protein n=1 Tax=Pseudogemmobacter sp. W21_MBD1_M6 TaxID=3240271 RepID=UPI003F9BE26C